MSSMSKIFSKLTEQEQIEWCEFITFKKLVNKGIIKHSKYIYEKPENIISMCAEVIFNQKQNNYCVPNKLKFLFDIKNEQDCLNKISFYMNN